MFTIRPTELAELGFLRDFAEQTFRVTYEAQNDPQAFNDYCAGAFTLERVRNEFLHPYSEFYFACRGDERVAYLKFNLDRHPDEVGSQQTLQVQRIYIAPEFQGHGLGRQLLDFAQQRAAQADLDWVWLSVWQKAPATVAFYEHCGFEKCGTEWFPLGDDPQPDWLMRRKVAKP
ncbi:MAG: GNAT family N-acetyltransferase [Saprospiraceae bacterium]